ncbi:hypothetical protein [Phyllobacterium zundukense]|uniref:hypothetical protein n=1 Tax=Phyllobacterium zundukense TaxID=1867719 RepID=UPI000C5674D5|nr:hypothetical protein BLM14_18465 [Phyllobacterium zundukense]
MKTYCARPESTGISRFQNILALFLLLLLSVLDVAPAAAGKLVLVNLPDIVETTTVGTGQGKRAIFKNAGSVDGAGIDLVAKLVIANLDHTFGVSAGKPSEFSAGPDTAWVDWYIYKAGTYNLTTDSGGVAVGMRFGEVRQRLDEDRGAFSDWETSTAHLGIIRADVSFIKSWDALVEGRVLAMPEAKTTDYGALVALYRNVGDNFKIGVGYNFGCFSDDLRDLTLNDEGVFLNVVGKF